MVVWITRGRSTAATRTQWENQAKTREEIRAALQGRKGFRDIQFLWDIEDSGEYVSLSYWDSLEDLEEYRKSPGREDAVAKISLVRGSDITRMSYIVG